VQILIADDSKPARMLTARALKKYSVELSEATDGEEAYQKIKHGNYDIVLLDNNMPLLRGIDLLAKLQAEGVPANAIMISARNDKFTIEMAKNHGALDYIIKPFKMEVLIDKINESLNKLGKPLLSMTNLHV